MAWARPQAEREGRASARRVILAPDPTGEANHPRSRPLRVVGPMVTPAIAPGYRQQHNASHSARNRSCSAMAAPGSNPMKSPIFVFFHPRGRGDSARDGAVIPRLVDLSRLSLAIARLVRSQASGTSRWIS